MAREDLIRQYSTANIPTADMGQVVDQLMHVVKDERRPHERRWYDNQFFYDGYHFRYLRRTDNKIVDLSERATMWSPMRAIPKATRQVDGVANLLISQDYIPIIYPERVYKEGFSDPQEYQLAMQEAKRIAKTSGHWVSEEFKDQHITEKLAHMVMLSGISSISWIQIWPDAVKEAIKTQVYDAFDIHVLGTFTEVEDLPFIIKGVPMLISEIKANENYDPMQLMRITPDNKHASSEIKDAYMRSRYGRDTSSDQTATLILKEAMVKEYLSSENKDRILAQEDGAEILEEKKEGDPVYRNVHVAGNIEVYDKYVDLPSYPYVEYRMKPGPMYQTPLIERFIPQNKSYDMFISRAERFAHTMTVGAWAKKRGEQYKIDNSAGGQIVEYQTTPPVPIPLPSIPGFYFNLMQMIQGNIEEQGVTTSILGKLPSGVKGNAAIESLKESEYSSLVIAQRRLKDTVRRIAEKMLDIADKHFVTPQTVYYLEKGEPQYFDVIGATAIKKRQEAALDTPVGAIPLKKDYKVDIEVQSGMAYTREGEKAAAKELGDYMLQLAEMGVLPPNVVQIFLQTMLETYKFGPTAEVMEAMQEVESQGNLTDQQIDAIKLAVLEVLKDAGVVGTEAEEKLIESTKVGVVEALRDTGMIDGKPQNPKDQVEIAARVQDMEIKQEEHDLKIKQMEQDIELKKEEGQQKMNMKRVQTAHDMTLKEKMAQEKAKQMKGVQNAAKKGKK